MSQTSRITQKAQGNYPPPGDTTSEGGSGGDTFAPVSQRGLIDQTTEGQPLGNEIQDAQQGTDEWSQRHYEQDKRHTAGPGLDPINQRNEALKTETKDCRTDTYQDNA